MLAPSAELSHQEAPQGAVFEGLFELTQELKERGAELAMISDADEALACGAFGMKMAGPLPEWLSPIPAVVPGQLLAYHLTAAKGYDPEHPRGLTKVTRTL